jgi:hypothetical protein
MRMTYNCQNDLALQKAKVGSLVEASIGYTENLLARLDIPAAGKAETETRDITKSPDLTDRGFLYF